MMTRRKINKKSLITHMLIKYSIQLKETRSKMKTLSSITRKKKTQKKKRKPKRRKRMMMMKNNNLL